MHSTKLDKAIAGWEPAPASFYGASDILGLIYRNKVLEERVSNYPAFLALGQRQEFQELHDDTNFHKLFQGGASIEEIYHYPKIHALVHSPDFIAEIDRIATTDLPDLREFLETGRSSKYSAEKIVGFWVLNSDATFALERKRRSNLNTMLLARLKKEIADSADTTFIATLNQQVKLKLVSAPLRARRVPPTVLDGSWKNAGDYEIKFSSAAAKGEIVNATVGGDRLTLPTRRMIFVFDREI